MGSGFEETRVQVFVFWFFSDRIYRMNRIEIEKSDNLLWTP